MTEINLEIQTEKNSEFPFDLRRFKRLLILLSLIFSLSLLFFSKKEAAFSVLCGSGLFLVTFGALSIFKDVMLGSKDVVKILILLLKYPAIFCTLYLITTSSSLIFFSVGYLLFLPALCGEALLSKK